MMAFPTFGNPFGNSKEHEFDVLNHSAMKPYTCTCKFTCYGYFLFL